MLGVVFASVPAAPWLSAEHLQGQMVQITPDKQIIPISYDSLEDACAGG